jgi:hypothetical protein
MFFLETMQVILITIDGWDVFAARYGDLKNFDDVHHLWFSGPILSGIGASSICLHSPSVDLLPVTQQLAF